MEEFEIEELLPPSPLLLKGHNVKADEGFPSLGSPKQGDGNPLQYSCLENPRDGGAWWAAVYGVAELDTTEAI